MRPKSTMPREQFVRLCECGCGQPTLIAHRGGQPNRWLCGHNHGYTGGRRVVKGYVLLYRPEHPYADAHGYVREHRLVMEARLGRYLLPTELVHHKDECKSNNDFTNLELTTKADHNRIHHKRTGWGPNRDTCADCGTNAIPFKGLGRCARCYRAYRYQRDAA
jgi:hypothetical protein